MVFGKIVDCDGCAIVTEVVSENRCVVSLFVWFSFEGLIVLFLCDIETSEVDIVFLIKFCDDVGPLVAVADSV
jgi:hypothetical protein